MPRRILGFFPLLAGFSACLGFGFLFLSRPDSPPFPAKPAGALRVCAANLNFGNHRPSELTRQLLSARPDILLLAEWTGANADPETLRRAGYRLVLDHPRMGTHGLALFVHDGFEATARLHEAPISGPCRLPFLVARLRVGDRFLAGGLSSAPSQTGISSHGQPATEGPSRNITFLGVHAPPPVPSCKGTNLPYLEALAALLAAGRLREDLGPGRKGDPVLLAGDLNALPTSRALATLHRAGLTDLLGLSPGRAFKPTWSPLPAIPSMIRIDYILAGPAFKPLSARTLDFPASDHRAVLADLSPRPP